MFRHYLSGLILLFVCLCPWTQTQAQPDNLWYGLAWPYGDCRDGVSGVGGAVGCAESVYAGADRCQSGEYNVIGPSPSGGHWELTVQLRVDNSYPYDGVSCGSAAYWSQNFRLDEDCASVDATWNPTTGLCVEPYDCEDLLEESSFFLTVPDTQNGFVCSDPNDGHDCAAQPVSMRTCADGNCSGFYRYTGEECLGGFDVDFEDPPDQEPDVGCVSGGGVLACFENEDVNCGTVNGERVCLDSVPSGQCVFLGSGGMVCASDAAAPPAPTEADGTTPATPDGEFSGGPAGEDPSDFDYYGPGTVSGSGSTSTGAGEGGAPQGNSQSGEGEFEFPDGTASASSDCSVAPTCDGHNLMCGIIVQNWHSACQDIPSESEFLTGSDLDSYDTESLEGDEVGLGAFDGSGFIADECLPDMVLDLGSFFGTITFPFSAWCDLFTWIGMLVLAAAGLMSIRIVVEGL